MSYETIDLLNFPRKTVGKFGGKNVEFMNSSDMKCVPTFFYLKVQDSKAWFLESVLL